MMRPGRLARRNTVPRAFPSFRRVVGVLDKLDVRDGDEFWWIGFKDWLASRRYREGDVGGSGYHSSRGGCCQGMLDIPGLWLLICVAPFGG